MSGKERHSPCCSEGTRMNGPALTLLRERPDPLLRGPGGTLGLFGSSVRTRGLPGFAAVRRGSPRPGIPRSCRPHAAACAAALGPPGGASGAGAAKDGAAAPALARSRPACAHWRALPRGEAVGWRARQSARPRPAPRSPAGPGLVLGGAEGASLSPREFVGVAGGHRAPDR